MNDAVDRWIQRVALAALVALAATLVTVGVVLYAPAPGDASPARVSEALSASQPPR